MDDEIKKLMLEYKKKLRDSANKHQQRYEAEKELNVLTSEKITQQFIEEEAMSIASEYVVKLIEPKIEEAIRGG